MKKVDKRKLIAVGVAGLLVPTIGNWAQQCMGGPCPAFTTGNVIAPAVPTILTTVTALIALFTQPHKQ